LGLPLDDELLELDEDELLEEVLDELEEEEELDVEELLLELLVLALEELLVLEELLLELVEEVPPHAANNNKAMDAGIKDRIMGGFPCCWVGFIRIRVNGYLCRKVNGNPLSDG
jgi:hypothetical protein